MQLTLDLPDELSAALGDPGSDLPRAALEAIVLEAYRERKLTAAQLRRLLGFETRYELDGFLKRHEVWLDYTWQDLEQWANLRRVPARSQNKTLNFRNSPCPPLSR